MSNIFVKLGHGQVANLAALRRPQPSSTDVPDMTLAALRGATLQILRALNLTERCVARSTAFNDFVSMTFYVPQPTRDDAEVVAQVFRVLCARHGWVLPTPVVQEGRNQILVTLQRVSAPGSQERRRMPL